MKYNLDIEQSNTQYGAVHIQVFHEPTQTLAASICTGGEEVDELTECLVSEVESMVDQCRNWLQ